MRFKVGSHEIVYNEPVKEPDNTLSIVLSDCDEEDEEDDDELCSLATLAKSDSSVTEGAVSNLNRNGSHSSSPTKPNILSAGGAISDGNNPNHLTSFRTPHTQFSSNKNEEFQFEVPPDAPIFTPTEEEFKNPLVYINKIRPIAEQYGICKIKPPAAWQPPFTVDVDKLKFTPRVQRLNELEAKTRVKLNFLDQIAKFWELQGSSLKIPMVERKALDLYSLHRLVQEEGGIEQATNNRKWSRVAARMGYPQEKRVGTILKNHYERILFPFDVYTSGKVMELKLETCTDEKDYKPHDIESRQQVCPPNETTARRSQRFSQQPAKDTEKKDILSEISKEVEDPRLIPFYAACLKSSMFRSPGKNDKVRMGLVKSPSKNDINRKSNSDFLAKYACHTCERGDFEEAMLLCDGCDDSYHTFCLIPPLTEIPKGDWRCPKCVVEEVNKPIEAFGFEQAQREYTLQQFGEMADRFKSEYFNMPAHAVSTGLVEREFWRIVSSIDEDVTVEYGADLHTMDHGSGFPTKSSLNLAKTDQEYADSSWNLNNLPVLDESVLGNINADISGMKVPWMYVGMCFSAFCWHIEDHWSYSVNYLHWGEPKTWYGVPGSKAEAFEETMKSAAPELFQSQPDLLHQLVTIMNPNISMQAGIPIYRTDQRSGEFVVTFPRAYHAGFNQGYNFAEAVNFAPADWMKMGRECVNHYSSLRRFCVFSHDELVCKMAIDPEHLNFGIATACYLDMAEMVDSEKKLRKSLLEWGVTKAERVVFESLPDDERLCDHCKTTCFLSAVVCSCSKNLVCLRHYSELCKCLPENHTLKYRYTLDELPLMLKKLKSRTETFENWLRKIREIINPQSLSIKISLAELQQLSTEGETHKFANPVLLERLNTAILEAEKCVTVIQQLDIHKARTRKKISIDNTKYKLSMEELELFIQEIDNLWCTIKEGDSVRELQKMGKEFMKNSERLLNTTLNDLTCDDLKNVIEEGSSLCIELPEVNLLKEKLSKYNWYKIIHEYHKNGDKMPITILKRYLTEGSALLTDSIIEQEMTYLKSLNLLVIEWEKQVKDCFEVFTEKNIPELEVLLDKGEKIPVILPSYNVLKEGIQKLKDWLQTVQDLQANENYPYFETLETVVNVGKTIPFKCEELEKLEEHLLAARNWKERTCRTFLKKKSFFNLLEALSPRIYSVMYPKNNSNLNNFSNKFTEDLTPNKMLALFKSADEKELREMNALRKQNQNKDPETDKYCICENYFYGNMYNCQLCKNWFHSNCVTPPKNPVQSRNLNNSPAGVSFNIPERGTKYLCESCMRSRRPRLETILTLLVSLQKIPVRIPEGEALQCLAEKAMNWQERTKKFLAHPDLRKKIEKYKSLPVKEVTITIDTSSDEEDRSLCNGETSSNNGTLSEKGGMKTEPSFLMKKENVDPITTAEQPIIIISENIKVGLEKLMLEGDLLEVSIDETNHLWHILNASKIYFSELENIHFRYTIKPAPTEPLVNNKKRKVDEICLKKQVKLRKSTNDEDECTILSTDSEDDEVIILSNGEEETGTKPKLQTTQINYIPRTKKRGRKLKLTQSIVSNLGVDTITAGATAIVAKTSNKKKRDKKKKLLRLLSSTNLSLTTALG